MSDPILHGLPAISADEAYLRQAIPAALNGRNAGDRVLRAGLLDAPPDDVRWFRCAGAVAFAILRLDGLAVIADPEDGPASARLLERAEPMLAAIEQGLSITLEPFDLGPFGDNAPVLVSDIETLAHETAADAAPLDRLLLAIAPDTPILPSAAPCAPALTGHVPVKVQLRLAGPRLSPADAAMLAPGDLLLLGNGRLAASLRIAGGPEIAGTLTPAERCFAPDRHN